MKHEVITASAGSGKTYRLSNRIITLLLNGVEPQKIIALTFTRKAAGEFAGALFEKISLAAMDEDKAAQLSSDLGRAGQYRSQDYLRILEKVIAVLPELYLGTLDSFFTRMVQLFQLELGLSNGSGLQILEGAELDELRAEMIRELLQSGDISEEHQQAFLQDFKQANYGKEKVEVVKTMREFVQKWHQTYLQQNGLIHWGDLLAITEGRLVREWQGQSEERLEDWDAVFKERKVGHKSAEKGFADFAKKLESFIGGAGVDLKGLATKLIEIKDDLLSGIPTSFRYYGKEVSLDQEQSKRVGNVLQAVTDEELRVPAERARAMYLVISVYEVVYSQLGRQAGKLAFDDLKYLLGQWQSSEEARLQREAIDYRLDARYDHWLLDEFQDTSQDQWNSLETLLDEVGQDRSGERSLFVVGDTKQAIYQWRGGDPKLFGDVAQRYGIEPEGMSVSWRSQEPVLSLVNTICGNEAVMRAKFGNAVDKWEWQEHRKADKLPEKSAYSEVREFSDAEDKQSHLIFILRELKPVERKLSCAILVRKNNDVQKYAELLKKEGFPVAEEGVVSPATDNPLGLLVLDWLKWMADPSDLFALNHLKISPLIEVFPQLISRAEEQWEEWNVSMHMRGVVSLLEQVFASIPLSSFALDRMEIIREFLRDQGADLAVLIRQLENFRVSVAEASNVIQVMTIHQSKGLGFEIVILPELVNKSLIDATRYNEVMVANEHGVSFQTPPVKWAQAMYPTITEHEKSWRQEQYYEAFCLLYVALTRAKRGLYCMLDSSERARPSDGFGAWISEALPPFKADDGSLLYRDGNSEWTEDVEVTPLSIREAGKGITIKLPLKRGRSTGGRQDFARKAFSDRATLDRGIKVHEVMECIDWLPPLPQTLPEDLVTVLQSLPDGDRYIAKLNQPKIRNLFLEPSIKAQLFREQSLEWIGNDGLWNTARLDRFVVFCNESGEPSRIQLIDFKTDEADGLEQKYEDQLNHYQEGLRTLYGDIPIESRLVKLS